MNAKVPARVRAAGIKLGSPEFDLAIEAMGAASYRFLEAAALLEDGWCPGDPVEVRR